MYFGDAPHLKAKNSHPSVRHAARETVIWSGSKIRVLLPDNPDNMWRLYSRMRVICDSSTSQFFHTSSTIEEPPPPLTIPVGLSVYIPIFPPLPCLTFYTAPLPQLVHDRRSVLALMWQELTRQSTSDPCRSLIISLASDDNKREQRANLLGSSYHLTLTFQ